MAGTKSFVAKPGSVETQWWHIDGQDVIVGRMATKIAMMLMGKHRPTYTPHIDTGDFVVVTNVDKIQFSGKKMDQKTYARYSGYPGLKVQTAEEVKQRSPETILREAVRRMLPKNKLGRHMLTKLKCYVGGEHPHQAQNPQPLNFEFKKI
ncbi:MAG: 50S ribosomal protein L13 [Pirellulaceae bacterium]